MRLKLVIKQLKGEIGFAGSSTNRLTPNRTSVSSEKIIESVSKTPQPKVCIKFLRKSCIKIIENTVAYR
jgi:hypothetical protein